MSLVHERDLFLINEHDLVLILFLIFERDLVLTPKRDFLHITKRELSLYSSPYT